MCACVRQGTEWKQLQVGSSEKTWRILFEVVIEDADMGVSEGREGEAEGLGEVRMR